jgi:tetratricopeptide (TPR) repeat protein
MIPSYNFALEAQRMLGSGQAGDAVALCEAGLDVYPEYSTAYAILARAYLQMNDIESAYQTVRRGLSRFPANKALLLLDDDLRPLALNAEDVASGVIRDVLTSSTISPKVATVSLLETDESITTKTSIDEQKSDKLLQQISHQSEIIQDVELEKSEKQFQEEHPTEIILNAVEDIDSTQIITDSSTSDEVVRGEIDSESAPSNSSIQDTETKGIPFNYVDIGAGEALSNIDDDNDNWQEAELLGEELIVDSILDTLTETNYTVEETTLIRTSEIESGEEILSDGLSNVEDDTIGWSEVKDLSNEVVESQLIAEITRFEQIEHEQEKRKREKTIENLKVVDGTIVFNGTIEELKSAVQTQSEYQLLRPTSQLRLIDTAKVDERASHVLRSSNMRLIPGLEYTPLRIESSRKPKTHILRSLPEPPPFPAIRGSRLLHSKMVPFASQIPVHIEAPRSNAVSKPYFTENNLSQYQVNSQSKKTSNDIHADNKSVELSVETQHTTNYSEFKKLSPLEELAARLERARIPAVAEEQEKNISPSLQEPMMISETMAMIYERQGAYDQAIKAYQQLARVKPERLEFYEIKLAELRRKVEGS